MSRSRKVIFKRSFIVEDDNRLFRYTETIEELTTIVNIETIDLTEEGLAERASSGTLQSSSTVATGPEKIHKKVMSATNDRCVNFAAFTPQRCSPDVSILSRQYVSSDGDRSPLWGVPAANCPTSPVYSVDSVFPN